MHQITMKISNENVALLVNFERKFSVVTLVTITIINGKKNTLNRNTIFGESYADVETAGIYRNIDGDR